MAEAEAEELDAGARRCARPKESWYCTCAKATLEILPKAQGFKLVNLVNFSPAG